MGGRVSAGTVYLVSVGTDIRVGLDERHTRSIVAGLRGSRWVDAERIKVTLISGVAQDATPLFRRKGA